MFKFNQSDKLFFFYCFCFSFTLLVDFPKSFQNPPLNFSPLAKVLSPLDLKGQKAVIIESL